MSAVLSPLTAINVSPSLIWPVRDAGSALLLRVIADEWELVPAVRARRGGSVASGVCDLCRATCAGDLAHVLLRCPCAELAGVRAAWLADVEATLVDAGHGAWWASLPATLDGRGAAALGHLTAERDGGTARALRDELTRLFITHVGGWWSAAGDDVISRLTAA